MLLTSLALAISQPFGLPARLQGAVESAKVVINEDPETWTVEYPRIIRPFVVEYRKCLNLVDRRVTGRPDFEVQHRSDVPRCAQEREDAMASAAAEMEGAKTRLGANELAAVFDTVGFIHIARGRDLDDQFKQRVAASQNAQTQYQAERPKGLVLDLFDGSVVKSRAEVEGEARAAAQNTPQNSPQNGSIE